MWTPVDLKLEWLDPAEGREDPDGKALKVRGHGTGFTKGTQLLLVRRTRERDTHRPGDFLPCNDVVIRKGSTDLEFELSLEGIKPGTFDAVVWNPPLKPSQTSERYVLEEAFTVLRPE